MRNLKESPVIRMAGSDGETYEATADLASEMAAAARDEGVELKPFVKTKDAEGNVHEISPFDGAALKEADARGDERHFDGDVEEDYFSMDALKAGAARFAIGLVNPMDWIRGIGTAAGTIGRGQAKGTVGLAINALRGGTHLGESVANAITGEDGHAVSDFIGKVNEGFNTVVDYITPDFFELTGEYDGVAGAKEATGAMRDVAELVANVKGIGSITKGVKAAQVAKGVGAATAAREAHAVTGAMFGLGKYGDVATDPNGPGGARQQVAALAAGAADAVLFGLWNPFKVSAKYAAELKPFMEQTRREVMKRVMLKLGQMAESGATMATVEAVKQGAEQLAGVGMDGGSGAPEPLPKDGSPKTWGERSWEDSVKEIGSQFLVGSAFAAMETVEGLPGRVAHWRASRAQDPNGQLKVAMSYQVERNRKAICPQRHQQALYAFDRFVKQGRRPESFAEGLSFGEDVRRVNEDGSVVFDDGSVWRMALATEGEGARYRATITISDGTILDAETGDLLGFRARREAGEAEQSSAVDAGTDGGSGAPEPLPKDETTEKGAPEPLPKDGETEVRPESNAMLLLEQMDEGKLPVAELDIAAIEGRAPTENGSAIEAYDPEKATPIIVLEDLEGNLHALTGGKRLGMAAASGAETIKAVVVRESEGWTADMAGGLGAIENIRQGNATLNNIVEAYDTLGAEQVQQLAGWHQQKGSRDDFASRIRRGISVAQKAGAELKQALAEGRIGEEAAYNAAQVLSMDRVGEGWETAQRAFADLAGRVGPEEAEAVLWGLQQRLAKHSLAVDVDWKAAIAEERAKFNAKKGAKDGALDSDAILIETGDGELKTLGEVEAETGKAEQSSAVDAGTDGETGNWGAAQGAGENRAVELRPVAGKDGVFTTLAFPNLRLTVDGGSGKLVVDGLTIDDFAGGSLERMSALVAKVEAFAAEKGLQVGHYEDDVMAAWKTLRSNIKAEGEAAYSAAQVEARRKTVVEQLKKSGLAEGVVETAEDFDRMFREMSGEALRSGEEVYGFVDPKTKKIYLNPEFFATRQGLEVPIHEFGHLGIIACEKANKAVYDRGMKLAMELLAEQSSAVDAGTDGGSGAPEPRTKDGSTEKGAPEPRPKDGSTGVRGLVDFILSDRVYSGQSREVQAQELLAQLIGKRGEEALRAETNKSVKAKIKSWLVEFWNTFGKALGLKDITPEEAAKMTLEDVADAIRAEMFSGRKYGEGFGGVEFSGGGARAVAKPTRIKRKLTGRRKAVNDFVEKMGGAEDPANIETDLLALWVDNGGRLFDKIPFEIETGYSKGASGVKLRKSSVADEFAESTAFYKDLTAAQRAVYFGTGKQEHGAIGEGLATSLKDAGITRFTREDGTVDFEAVIEEFERQWTNYERGEKFLKERGEWEEEHDRAMVEEMERAEAEERAAEMAAGDEASAAEAEARAEAEAAGVMFSRAVKPSKLGDGKQRYYEVPFDKAVDKIVKAKKPVSKEHVFVSETPKPFADIGFARLPVMMGQGHVISCYFGEGEGVEGKHLHKMKGNLKLLPKALEKPLMIITSESSPRDSVVAILKMKDNTGASVIVPVKMSGVGRAGGTQIDAHIALTMFGKKNAWKKLVADAIEKEANGEVGVFYIDGAESKTILERLGDKAKGLGVAGLQSPRETKAHRNPENGNSGLQSPSVSISQGTLHSIADEGSPVKGGIVSQTATRQFKNWFGGSKVVDANGEPLVVWHGTDDIFTEFKPEEMRQREGSFFFAENREDAEAYSGSGRVMPVFVSLRNPFDYENGTVPDAYKERWRNAKDKRDQVAILKELGYDGWLANFENGKGWGEVSAFYPNQVKSATDNIGTFDPGNNDIRFSRGATPSHPEVEHVKLTRVADDAGQGERTPGALAASVELNRTAPTPLTTRGTRYVALPLSEMNALARYLTGHALPAEMESGRKLGAAGKVERSSTIKARRKIVIAADVLGVVDKTDMEAEKTALKDHGFFANEDPGWVATHSPAEVRKERERSEEALSGRLEKLADRRTRGVEAGGFAAGRKVFADQLAKVVMAMPHGQPGVLGAMQTVAGALEKRVRGSETEADAFLDWMKGPLPKDASVRKLEMFAAFLIMPKEMEARAKGWYDAIRSTIAGDKKLADAFRKMTVRSMTAQGFGHLQSEIMKMQDAQTEAAIKKLQAEANEPIKAGGKFAQAAEAVVLSCDDRMGAAMVRVDARLRNYTAAQKLAMKAARTPEERAAIKQQTDAFIGEIAQAKNQVELSRTAWERGHDNADARYLWRMVDLLNEATVRDGLRTQDLSFYLDLQRVIETKGLSGARGQSTRQAQLMLDAMRKRLGADFAKVEAFAAKFHAIHEQELLSDPVLERVLGKGTADYWRSQTHYVTTKRQFSPEELAEIEAARREIEHSSTIKAGGDTVIGEMYKYCGRPEATAKLRGSFADKQEVMSATFEKVAAIKKFLRRNEYVIELRDLLLKAKVEGVHDYASGKSEFPQNRRYGSIGYMENGQKRTLVVPREIADGFKAQGDFNNAALRMCGSVNNWARQLWIDWNPVYWQRNIGRNAGSIEMNMPGMRESVVKRGARFVFPGLAPVTEMAMTHLVRHIPERMSLPLRRIWGEHTALFYAPKAKRMAMWLTDHSEMQRRLWEAEKRGDLGAVQELEQDRSEMLAALKANMLVGISAGKAGGTTGFLDDSVKTVGKTMLREVQEWNAKSKFRKALDAANIFRKNAEQQVFEDIMAKFSAYLHDRAQFGKGNMRSAAESGLVVKKNVSIGEGERKGQSARGIQAIFQPFWNMVEKGVVRNVRAYRDRPGETFQKAAWRIAPMILQGLIGSGAVAAWILRANDDDEEKVKSGPLGDVYRYLRDAQRAHQNCSNYVRENYHVTPLWTDGYTSVVIGMPLTDEERMLKPIARFVADAASVAAGTKESMEVAGFLSDATGVVAPDFKIAGALPTLLDDTVHALWENPDDYYTGGKKYDSDTWTLRNESWGMRGRFMAAMGKRLWNDFGGRNVLPVDRGGVDNGLGRAPGWVSAAVAEIPVASPILRSFIKIQVGSPKRDAAEITEAERRVAAVCRIHGRELFEIARREKRDISVDRGRYLGMLEKWQKAEGLSDEDLANIEGRYINAWNAYEGAQYRADGEREKYRAKAEKLGLEAAHLWLDFD